MGWGGGSVAIVQYRLCIRLLILLLGRGLSSCVAVGYCRLDGWWPLAVAGVVGELSAYS